ncbi:MAG: DNA-binding protein [Deltaproteobacteria bacterium]|nr:MAG: DNA-binding protein [Deltaproteobacteria bacterium]
MPYQGIPIESLSQSEIRAEREVDADALNAEFDERGVNDVRALGPLKGSARITRSGPDIFVIGSLEAKVELSCVRCLENFRRDVSGEFHLDLTREPLGFEDEPGEIELSEAELEVEYIEGDVLELEPILIEQLLLALPDYPACPAGCELNCPRCGEAMNAGSCGCEDKDVDPRFAALKGFKVKKQ